MQSRENMWIFLESTNAAAIQETLDPINLVGGLSRLSVLAYGQISLILLLSMDSFKSVFEHIEMKEMAFFIWISKLMMKKVMLQIYFCSEGLMLIREPKRCIPTALQIWPLYERLSTVYFLSLLSAISCPK